MSSATHQPFLTLPGEVRNVIYCALANMRMEDASGLLLSCHQVKREFEHVALRSRTSLIASVKRAFKDEHIAELVIAAPRYYRDLAVLKIEVPRSLCTGQDSDPNLESPLFPLLVLPLTMLKLTIWNDRASSGLTSYGYPLLDRTVLPKNLRECVKEYLGYSKEGSGTNILKQFHARYIELDWGTKISGYAAMGLTLQFLTAVDLGKYPSLKRVQVKGGPLKFYGYPFSSKAIYMPKVSGQNDGLIRFELGV